MSRIMHQGSPGSFSHHTALEIFGDKHDYIGVYSFSKIFDGVWRGYADYGVLPLENSLAGSIYENYDGLCKFPLEIVGETYTRIEHCLLGKAQVKNMRKIYSHPKALEQCQVFFEKHPWLEKGISTDTASAAAEIARNGDRTLGAIASEEAGHLYGLDIIARNIEDNPENYTRFVIISFPKVRDISYDKCSLMLILNHTPGALQNILTVFLEYGVNLTKIESRPLVGKPFEYIFYLDFTHTNLQDILDKLLLDLESKVRQVKVLGRYTMGSIP